MLAVLLALTSCSKSDNPTPYPETPAPAKAIIGEWFGQIMAGGMVSNNQFYDNIAMLMTFQADGHGLIQQYFLNGDQLVYHLGHSTDYTVNDDGIVSIFIAGTNKPLGVDAHIVDGKVAVSIPDYFVYDLWFDHPTAVQQQLTREWGVIINQWQENAGEDDDDTKTEVTTDGADEPGRARRH
jgi:hypothetical protein